MTDKIYVTYTDRYYNYDTNSFSVKAGERVSISNLSKKSYMTNASGEKVRRYEDNTLYSGETRVTWTGDSVFYSCNSQGNDYTYRAQDYYNSNHGFYPEYYHNDAERFYEDYYDGSGSTFIKQGKRRDDIGKYNPDSFMVDEQQNSVLYKVINATKTDGEDTLSEADLKLMREKLAKNKDAYKNEGITRIAYDGNQGIYRVYYNHKIQELNPETGNLETIKIEERSLTFDFVLQGETQTVQDFEDIAEKVAEFESDQVESFAKRVRNYTNPLYW